MRRDRIRYTLDEVTFFPIHFVLLPSPLSVLFLYMIWIKASADAESYTCCYHLASNMSVLEIDFAVSNL